MLSKIGLQRYGFQKCKARVDVKFIDPIWVYRDSVVFRSVVGLVKQPHRPENQEPGPGAGSKNQKSAS